MIQKRITRSVDASQFHPNDIVGIILDVKDYKDFIPYCSSSKVLKKQSDVYIAEVVISFSIFKITYTSRIEFKEENGFSTIEVVEAENGQNKIFNHLENRWIITQLNDKVIIDFFVKFELKNKILNILSSKMIDIVSNSIIDAFLKRGLAKNARSLSKTI